MKLSDRARRAIKTTAKAFFFRLKKNPHAAFADNAYYVTMAGKLCSLTPHYSWREAHRAAKKFHSKAFFIKGRILNRELKKAEWDTHKVRWGVYNAAPNLSYGK